MKVCFATDLEGRLLRRYKRFFADIEQCADDSALRLLAHEMREEEQDHIAMVEKALAQAPSDHVDWPAALARGPR